MPTSFRGQSTQAITTNLPACIETTKTHLLRIEEVVIYFISQIS